jgi:hypothetical protein
MNTVDDPPYKPHQRIGVISNAHAGRDFECSVQAFLSGQVLRTPGIKGATDRPVAPD